MLGFETIGNATAICYDDGPVLATDPWIAGDAYFGSWAKPFDIPAEQMDAVRRAKYIWLSHGHPDHTNAASLDILSGKTILLPDHVGGRMARDLTNLGFTIRIMPDRKWLALSPGVKAMCISDYNQDAILLIDVGGTLLVDVNDADERGWGRFVKKIIASYSESFLLRLFGYGDADMINIFREDGTRLLYPSPEASAEDRAFWDGLLQEKLRFWTTYFGTTHMIPFSMFHVYQRTDSVWAEAYRTPLDRIENAKVGACEILPSFIRFDSRSKTLTRLCPPAAEVSPKDPSVFGDDWSEQLTSDEAQAVKRYIGEVEHLRGRVDFIRFRVGGREHTIDFAAAGEGRGLTFEVPRGSLLSAIQFECFDDLLIGNFMKTTMHGDWGTALAPTVLYANFTPWITRYADNGHAKTKQQLDGYFQAYRQRARVDYLLHRFERAGAQKLRTLIRPRSPLFRLATRTYSIVKRAR